MGLDISADRPKLFGSLFGSVTYPRSQTVTQITSSITAVGINGLSGQITTVAQSLGNGVKTTFTVNNPAVEADDVVLVCFRTNGVSGPKHAEVAVTRVINGAFDITLIGTQATTYDVVPVINFVVIKTVQGDA